jgi:hypothetical protein
VRWNPDVLGAPAGTPAGTASGSGAPSGTPAAVGGFEVDGEDLARVAALLDEAGAAVARLAGVLHGVLLRFGTVAADLLDPAAALSAQATLVAALDGPGGLLALAARLAADAARMTACQLGYAAADSALVRGIGRLLDDVARGRPHDAASEVSLLPGEALADGLPLALTAGVLLGRIGGPGTRGALRVATGPLLTGVALALDRSAVDGPGGVWPARVAGAAARLPGSAGPDLGALDAPLRDVAALGRLGHGMIAVREVADPGGPPRYVVELPGMAGWSATPYPQQFAGALAAAELPRCAYSRAVGKALTAADVPAGADLLLVGHSEGGLVALELAADPAFNGPRGRFHVTHVLAAGVPDDARPAAAGSGTSVLVLQNTDDPITYLGGGVSAGGGPLAVDAFAGPPLDAAPGALGAHAAVGYARWAAELSAGSTNPAFAGFVAGVAPYLYAPVLDTRVLTVTNGPGPLG